MNHKVKYVVISAAGLGSRLELNMPKCLVEIGGRRIIDYQLDLVKDIPNVRIVVGFMEEAVINHVRAIRNDVVFVRNPDYQTTSNSYSLYLATRDLKEPFLSIDGDLLINTDSFRNFVEQCDGSCSIVGITESKTEEAVFVQLDDTDEKVTGFYEFNPVMKYEWCGVAYVKEIRINKNQGYVYKEFEPHLPLKAHIIDCFEIDTPDDLNHALTHFKF